MKSIKPHLSPELRAQITPHSRRDTKYAFAGVFFLLLSVFLSYNLWPKSGSSSNNNKTVATFIQTQDLATSVNAGSNQTVLGAETQVQSPETPNADQFTIYSVKNGDTLFNISQKYNVKWDLIAQLNSLSEPYVLHSGQSLKIPQATTSKVPNKVYTVAAGENLTAIAKKFNVTTDDIIAVNPNLQKSDLVTAGQIIKLP
ncbi:MAG: LysM peptidoglycan-binding domain-containing protein [Candidatus Doudnabacteria bacterium]|nr:LysM peptidoglycan-binding domain-containing protein [Candidatus Doudnabacteria bacterium]